MTRWEEKGCQPYGTETDEHGNQIFESKWCDGGVPMKSLCVGPGDRTHPPPRAERGEQDERAKYCGEGTVWKGEDHGCVATFEGAVRACEDHRGPDWAHTCRPLETCDTHEDDDNNIQDFYCHGDDLAGLFEDSQQMVSSCDPHTCHKDAFAAEGAPTHWYQAKCCATCKFSPKEDKWGSDLYGECATTQCSSGYHWFTNTSVGATIISDPRWSTDINFVQYITSHYPIAADAVACVCTRCGMFLEDEMWPVGRDACSRVHGSTYGQWGGYNGHAPSGSPHQPHYPTDNGHAASGSSHQPHHPTYNGYAPSGSPHQTQEDWIRRRRANTRYGRTLYW